MAIVLSLATLGCNSPKGETNPLLTDFDTPHQVPPFDKIKAEHFKPAYEAAIKQQQEKIAAIVASKEEPNFANTIEALEYSGLLLSKVESVFNNLTEANTSDSLQQIAEEVSPLVSANSDNINLNAGLFQKVKAIYDKKDNLGLNAEQAMLLHNTYQGFVRGGALLEAEKQTRFREINAELALLTLKFGDNLLSETNAFKLIIEKQEDLVGLPQSIVDGGAETAKENSMEGKWVYTLHSPSLFPFLQYSSNRDLREKIWTAYANRGNNNNENDNKEIIKKIVSLRIEKANMLGFSSHAAFVLDQNMAKTPDKVLEFLDKLWVPALKVAEKEAKELQAMIDREGGKFKLQPWDWRYYAEKLRKEKYDLDEEQLRPYFELNQVREGMFSVVTKLYGLQFKAINDVPKPHPDAIAYEILNADNSLVGIFYMDFHPRASKRGGAWMDNYRDQYIYNGVETRPVITNVCNFSKPTATEPSLLTLDEVETMYHEFGHALHGLLTKCTYPGISGTSVARDFVELPSQIMENWATCPEVLKMYAKHYKTGEAIPDELIEKIQKSGLFNQGFGTTEYLAASLLDMNYHTLTQPLTENPMDFEARILTGKGLIPQIISRYRSTYFSHIFSGGYSSGYYSYIWAEVLDADAFEAFKEKGIFDPATALAFRTNILEKGGSEEAMKLYVQFRGMEPTIEPLLKNRGLQGK